MIPAHNDWPIRNREQQSEHIYYTLLQQVFALLCLLPASANCAKMLAKTILLSQVGMF
jgi:hypothetical protein